MAAKLYLPLTELTLYRDLHRSGWSWVLNHLYNDSDIIAKPTKSYAPDEDPSLTLLDSYLDRTFHWDYNLLKANGILPYTRNWIGILHHPFDPTYTGYNSSVLFQNADFIASLEHCKGLIVLSDYMLLLLRQNLYTLSSQTQNVDLNNIPTMTLTHPTDLTCPAFSMGNFLLNGSKKIIQIGTFLRDAYAIYKLPNLSIFNIQKSLLIPINSDPITKPEGFDELFQQQYNTDLEPFNDLNVITTAPYVDGDIPNLSNAQQNLTYYSMKPSLCRSIDSSCFGGNKYIKGVYDNYQRMDDEVQIIPSLTDADYDNLLTKNLVYIQLFDASAINTLNECIARNTPILINPVPAVVELLGPDYPFYYDQNNPSDINGSNFNLFSLRTIQHVSAYLNDIDKTRFDISTFIDQFVNSEIVSSL